MTIIVNCTDVITCKLSEMIMVLIQRHYGDFEVYLKVHRGAIYLTI